MSKTLDILLRPEIPNVLENLPTATYKIKRLCKLTGSDVTFTLRALPYGKVREIQDGSGDTTVKILLSGVVDPDLKAPALADRFGGVTPAETVKAMLLSGEIEDLTRAIESLSGYRRTTIEEIKKN